MIANQIQQLQEGLRSGLAAVVAAIQGATEAEVHQEPAPGEWTVAQALAHLAEVQSFWLSKALQITREDNPDVSRTPAEAKQRTDAVTIHARDSLAALKRRMAAANAEAVSAVGRIDPKDLGRVGNRGEGRTVTVSRLMQNMEAHLKEHAGQINEALRVIREKR